MSGYHTVNDVLKREIRLHGVSKFAHLRFVNITDEPARFHTFVDEMMDPQHGFEFVSTPPVFHVMSQTQILSVSQVDLQFILKAEHLETAYNFMAKELCPHSLNAVDSLPTVNVNKSPRPEWTGLDEKTLQRLFQHFKQDYDCFGYDLDQHLNLES